ncbi:MAG TPA: hypothetical protein VMA37_04255 [Acetobacteraceae bacterium]|nr:hypothetical protein [Acetobacteraceae bacterium]
MLSTVEKKGGQPPYIAHLAEDDDLTLRIAQLMGGLDEQVQLKQRLAQEKALKLIECESKEGRRCDGFRRIDVAACLHQTKQVARPHEAQDLARTVRQMSAEPYHPVVYQIEEMCVFAFRKDGDAARLIGNTNPL